MAFSSIELTTVSRAQDYSTMKQNEDNKAFVDQSKEVHSGDNAQWSDKQPDARQKGNGEYRGDGGKRRKQQPREQMVVKEKKGFDIKI